MLTKQQLIDRHGRIGASDVPVVMGVSKWKSPYELWAEKTGRLRPKEDEESAPAGVGHVIEPWLLDQAARDLGPVSYRGAEVARPDGVIVSTLDGAVMIGGHLEPVEAKTQGLFGPVYENWGDAGSDEIPPRFYWQLQAQMDCLGARNGHLYALLGGRGVCKFTVQRDPRTAAVLEEVVQWFIDHVALDEEPQHGIQEADVIRRMKVRGDQQVDLGPEFLDLLNEYHQIGSDAKAAEKRKEEIKAAFIVALGDSPVGVLPDMRIVKFGEINVAGYTVPPNTYRRLDLPRAKRK